MDLSILNPIFNPILTLVYDPNNPFFGAILCVFIIATIVALVTTISNKVLVDQNLLQFLQKEMKEFQQDMIKAQKSKDPHEITRIQKKQSEFIKIQKEIMVNSFKPMIGTMIPLLIIYYWMMQNPFITPYVD
ncbi:MAG: EMC3/TMCO1 family protein [Methanobacterium sp.]|nr:EMC3/TMCO1 family protein [Methanobacterium sp.]